MNIKRTHDDEWNILSDDGEKLLGRIQVNSSFIGKMGSYKTLHVGEETNSLCRVKNQAEAIEKLKEFFSENKEEVKHIEKLIEELSIGLSQVSHQISINAINKEKKAQEDYLDTLKQRDLI